jgi:hypothetical protein
VACPIEQLRALCRWPNPSSNRSRRTSLSFRMDNLFVGMYPSTWPWRLTCPVLSSVFRFMEMVPKRYRSRFRRPVKSDRHEIGIGDRLHLGMAAGFISECRPGSDRNRDRQAPEYPRHNSDLVERCLRIVSVQVGPSHKERTGMASSKFPAHLRALSFSALFRLFRLAGAGSCNA